MKVREVLNRVCRAIGETQIDCSVETLDADNHIMLLEFMNQFKEKIEGSHQWRTLTGSFEAQLTAGSNSATILGANKRARLVRIHDQRLGQLVPLAYDITDPSRPVPLQEMDASLLRHRIFMDGGQTSQEPVYFTMQAVAPDTMQVIVHPKPANDRVLAFVLVNPQAYLDVRDLDTELQIPERALVIGTIWFALQERGEELGQGSMFTEDMFLKALDEEIAADSGESGSNDELVPV